MAEDLKVVPFAQQQHDSDLNRLVAQLNAKLDQIRSELNSLKSAVAALQVKVG